MDRAKLALVGLFSALGGLALGLLLAGPDTTAPAPPAAPATSARPADCPTCPACPDKVCADDIAATEVPPVVEHRRLSVREGPMDPPLEWPADLPPELTPEHFTRELEAVAEACGFADRLQTIDCASPPCMALVLSPADEKAPSIGPSTCPEWAERWGDAVAQHSSDVLCDDGSVQTMQAVGPYVPALDERVDKPEPDPDDPWTGMRAFLARVENMGADVGCSRPGTLTVENRLGHSLKWIPD